MAYLLPPKPHWIFWQAAGDKRQQLDYQAVIKISKACLVRLQQIEGEAHKMGSLWMT